MTAIYVIKVTYEKNATDGISYFTNKNELADAVFEAESIGGRVHLLGGKDFKLVNLIHYS